MRLYRKRLSYVDGNVITCQMFFMADAFKDRLKEIRERRGWSQAELAQKSGLQPTAISHFETGGRSPSFDNLRRLADALNVSTDYLIGRSNEPAMAGPQTDSLFRDLDKLSDDDLKAMEMMKDALLKKSTEKPK